MSIPISQFIPPPPPHLDVHVFVLYICVSISVFANKIIYTIFLDSTCMHIHIRYLFFSLGLASLFMTISRSNHISTSNPISLLFFFQCNLTVLVSNKSEQTRCQIQNSLRLLIYQHYSKSKYISIKT